MKQPANMIHVRPAPEEYDEIARRAEAHGVSIAAEARSLISRGLAAGVTPEELDAALREHMRAVDERIERAREDSRIKDERLDEAMRQMGIARKNIGKATQASYGALSLLSWLYADVMGYFKGIGVKGRRVDAFSKMSVADVFKLFEGSGGALQADPSTRYFASFRTSLRKPPFKDMDIEEIAGVSRAEWDRLTGESDDAAAVRSLAGKGKETRNG